jgi:hypothetical protein
VLSKFSPVEITPGLASTLPETSVPFPAEVLLVGPAPPNEGGEVEVESAKKASWFNDVAPRNKRMETYRDKRNLIILLVKLILLCIFRSPL